MVQPLSPIIPEHRFWLQIFGDKARFILNDLYPKEAEMIAESREFISLFDDLLAQARQALPENQLDILNRQAFRAAQDFRKFILHILLLQITGNAVINMAPAMLNVFVNETEQYINILTSYLENEEHVYNSITESITWMMNLYTSTVRIEQSIGISYVEFSVQARNYAHDFLILYLRAYIMKGFLRTGIKNLPALDQLNDDVQKKITEYAEFIVKLTELMKRKQFFGRITLLDLDSTYRQLCYFMTRLSAVSRIKAPVCDPASPRLES
jgi:hypothetical protein